MGMLRLLVACLQLRAAGGIAASDIPTFSFRCWASNTLDEAAPPPPPEPPAAPAPPLPCAVPCGKGFTCTDGVCCVDLLAEPRARCEANRSAYAFVLGSRMSGPLGKWYDSSTWAVNTTSVASRWGPPSAEFTAAMANATLQGEQGGFYKKFPAMGAQIGVRSSRLDTGILNITCRFALTGRDAGKKVTVTAAVQNTDCATCRGWTGMTGDDSGGYIGLMLGRASSSGAPSIETFASYNQRRYWANLDSVPTPKKIAKLFPILDEFVADGDITTQEDAFAAMHGKMGINLPQGALPPIWSGRSSGIPWGKNEPGYGIEGVLGTGGGFRKGSTTRYHNPADSEPCYSPNSSCTMHDYTMLNATDAGLVNASDIARAVNATFGDVAVKPGSIVASALADEPGWSMNKLWVPTDTSPIVQQRWVSYLEAQEMTPALLGAKAWAEVQPYRTHPDGRTPLPLTERRRFYWTVRFIHWDSCRYMADWTAALQAGAQDPTLQTYVNWNNFDGRMYVGDGEPFPKGTTAAMSYDWFEWARMKGGSMLWTEDWMPDSASHRWSYYSARMRSAIALSNRTGPEQEFAGYIVVGSSGQQEGGLLQRPLTMVGSGSKLVRYYNTGPEYMFPANSYSESANASRLMAEMAKANSMIAQAEHLLWTARRPPSTVAILYPRSSELWDQFHISKYARDSGALCLCCCVSSMVAHYIDYTAEAYALYLALATDSNIPVDFVDEDALEEPGTLSQYKLIWVTQPNIPAAGSAGLAEWVMQGGTLVTVSGTGGSDAYDEPSTTLSDLAGVREPPRERIEVMSDTTLNPFAPHSTPMLPSANGAVTLLPGGTSLPFFAQGAVGKLSSSGAGGAQVLGSFADGSDAITSKANGKGRAIHFAWLPGLSYWFSSDPGTIGNRPRAESLRQIIAGIATSVVGVVPPVSASVTRIETPLLLGPTKKTAVVTLLNFQEGQPVPAVPALHLNITVPFKPKAVSSVEHGFLTPTNVVAAAGGGADWVVSLTLPLQFGDFVLLS